MENSNRDDIISSLMLHAYEISNYSDLDDIILHHEKLLINFYAKKPLFYKTLFKSFRFYITSAIFSLYYCKSTPPLKIAKKIIMSQVKNISTNTLNSLFTLLVVSGRLEIYRSEERTREMLFRPSKSVGEEIYELIQSVLIPWEVHYCSKDKATVKGADAFIPAFFYRYSDFIFNHVTMEELLPTSALFIERDAGYMVMLILYKEYVLQKNQRIMLSTKKIASYSHASRTHIHKLLQEAQSAGLIAVENNLFIELSDKFVSMFQMYFSLYLAQILYACDIAPDSITHID